MASSVVWKTGTQALRTRRPIAASKETTSQFASQVSLRYPGSWYRSGVSSNHFPASASNRAMLPVDQRPIDHRPSDDGALHRQRAFHDHQLARIAMVAFE